MIVIHSLNRAKETNGESMQMGSSYRFDGINIPEWVGPGFALFFL